MRCHKSAEKRSSKRELEKINYPPAFGVMLSVDILPLACKGIRERNSMYMHFTEVQRELDGG